MLGRDYVLLVPEYDQTHFWRLGKQLMKAEGKCSPFLPSALCLCAEMYLRFTVSGREIKTNKHYVSISECDFALVFVQHLSRKEMSFFFFSSPLDPGTISVFNAVLFMKIMFLGMANVSRRVAIKMLK